MLINLIRSYKKYNNFSLFRRYNVNRSYYHWSYINNKYINNNIKIYNNSNNNNSINIIKIRNISKQGGQIREDLQNIVGKYETWLQRNPGRVGNINIYPSVMKKVNGIQVKVDAIFLVGVIILVSYLIYEYSDRISTPDLFTLNMQNSQMLAEIDEAVDTRFSDVIGCDEAREELEEVIEFLRDPDKFSTLGGKLPKGVLLIGPPGTGKTLLAKAVAGEAEVPFFSVSGSQFEEMFYGLGAARVRNLFAAARKKAPCVIFIDEVDGIGGTRQHGDSRDSSARACINQLLAEMDGFTSSDSIIVLAATNTPQHLDKALTRPGRFDKHVTVSPPDVKGRTELFQHYLTKTRYRASIDPSVLARGTTGATGATIMQIVNEAAVRAAKLKKDALDMKDLDWAKDKVLIGAERKMVMSEDEKLKTAYHEGGHTLVGLFTNDALPLYKVTILPRGQALGITFQLPRKDIYSMTRDEILAQIDVCMGGRVAEELKYGANKVGTGASNDFQKATQLARDMVEKYGMSDTFGTLNIMGAVEANHVSEHLLSQIDEETTRLLKESYDRVKNLLSSHLNELDKLALQLVNEETLTDEQVRKLLNLPLDKR